MADRRAALAAIFAFLSLGCSRIPIASSPVVPTSAGRDTPSSPAPGGSGPPPPGDCVTISSGSSRAPITIDSVRATATAVVIGTVAGLEPAVWTTPDGQRPTIGSDHVVSFVLWTPLRLADARTILGQIDDRRIGVVGGTSGCDSYYSTDVGVPSIGQRSVLVLLEANSSADRLGDILLAEEIWPVDGDEIAAGSGERLSVAELERRLKPAS